MSVLNSLDNVKSRLNTIFNQYKINIDEDKLLDYDLIVDDDFVQIKFNMKDDKSIEITYECDYVKIRITDGDDLEILGDM